MNFNYDKNNTSIQNHVRLEPFPIRIWILTCYIIITICGLLGNVLVMCIIRNNHKIKNTSFGVYLSGLAFVDFLVALFCLPTYVTSTSTFKHHPVGIAGDVMCKIISAYNSLFYFEMVSIFTLVSISIERYMAVCKPFSAYLNSLPSRAKKILFVIWLLCLLMAIPAVYGAKYSSTQTPSSIGAHCKVPLHTNGRLWNVLYNLINVVLFIIPLVIMTYCFIKIKKTLTKQVNHIKAKEIIQIAELRQAKKRRKTLVTIMFIVVSFFILWTPNQVAFKLYLFHVQTWNSDIMQVTIVLCFLSCSVNPFIYAFRSTLFRNGIKTMFGFQNCVTRYSIEKNRYLKLSEEQHLTANKK